MLNHLNKKWKRILPWAIGIIIGLFFAENLFGGVFYNLGYMIGEWIGSILS